MIHKSWMVLFFLVPFMSCLGIGSTTIRDENPQVRINKSGVYLNLDKGKFTISIKDGILSGVYEYYDNWDNRYNEYTAINVVYFYGYNKGRATYEIKAVSPGDDNIISGNCFFTEDYKTFKILLDDQPPGYAAFDFTKDEKNNVFPLTNSSGFLGVRIVKENKALLYNYINNEFIQRKAYLVNWDIVTVVDSLKNYYKINYHSPVTDKSTLYWIRRDNLYKENPQSWNK